MKKVLTVYVSPLEMDSTEYHLVDLPAAQDRLDTLLLEMNKGFPLYTEVSDYCGREYLLDHMPEDMDLKELNLLAGKLAEFDPTQEAAFEGLVRMDLDKGMTELPLCRLVDLANSVDCCHIAPGVENDEQLGHFYVDNDFPVLPPVFRRNCMKSWIMRPLAARPGWRRAAYSSLVAMLCSTATWM